MKEPRGINHGAPSGNRDSKLRTLLRGQLRLSAGQGWFRSDERIAASKIRHVPIVEFTEHGLYLVFKLSHCVFPFRTRRRLMPGVPLNSSGVPVRFDDLLPLPSHSGSRSPNRGVGKEFVP